MTLLEKYEMVNKCETVEQLQAAILELANPSGQIEGRTRMFDAKRMVGNVPPVVRYEIPANVLTREYGIRQQALYLGYYNR